MSEYKDMVRDEAKEFFDASYSEFKKDDGEHGGGSDSPNLGKWLDRTRKLFERLDETSKSWGRADAMMITQNSRNSVGYGDPKESAYFAFYKDVLVELKKLAKSKA